jgi:hypothetical protein
LSAGGGGGGGGGAIEAPRRARRSAVCQRCRHHPRRLLNHTRHLFGLLGQGRRAAATSCRIEVCCHPVSTLSPCTPPRPPALWGCVAQGPPRLSINRQRPHGAGIDRRRRARRRPTRRGWRRVAGATATAAGCRRALRRRRASDGRARRKWRSGSYRRPRCVSVERGVSVERDVSVERWPPGTSCERRQRRCTGPPCSRRKAWRPRSWRRRRRPQPRSHRHRRRLAGTTLPPSPCPSPAR